MVYNVDMIFLGNMTHCKITKKQKFEKSLEVVLIVGGNNNITHHMMYT